MNTVSYPIKQQVKAAARLRALYAARIAAEQRIHEQLQKRIQTMWRCSTGRGFSYLQVVVHQWMWDVARRDKAKLPPPSLGWRWS